MSPENKILLHQFREELGTGDPGLFVVFDVNNGCRFDIEVERGSRAETFWSVAQLSRITWALKEALAEGRLAIRRDGRAYRITGVHV